MSLLYLVAAISLLGIIAWTITRLRRTSTNGFLIGGFVCIFFSVLFMVKLRCAIDAYPCGFMSFTGGFTWHLFPGLIGFLGSWILISTFLNSIHALGWSAWMQRLGLAMSPLLGLSIALFWEVLPVQLIHPPTHGGPCPSLPIICHDTPWMGRGGLLYWTAPFVIWAVLSVWRDVTQVVRKGSVSW